MNYVKSDIKRIIDTALNKYDNIVYYHKYKRFYKGHYGIIEIIKDKVNLAIACLNKNISKYLGSSNLNGHPHSLFIDGVKDGLLRRDERNSKK